MDDISGKLILALTAGAISFAAAWFWRGRDRRNTFSDMRLARAEAVIVNLSVYIENWKKLISISNLASTRELSEAEKLRLERYVLDRDDAKHDLVSSINSLPLFFDGPVIDVFNEFKLWDTNNSTKRVDELPDIVEWETWLGTLATTLRKEVR